MNPKLKFIALAVGGRDLVDTAAFYARAETELTLV